MSDQRAQTAPGLSRPRLHRHFGMFPVVVVHGPAGSGKTTLLRQQAANWPGRVAWIDCDVFDRDPQSFTRRLSNALGFELELGGLSAGERLLVVVDEVERLAGSESTLVLDALVRRLGRGNVVVLGTRRIDALEQFERWRASDVLQVITGSDLRFRVWEVDRLFRDVYGIELTVDDIHAVSAASGGWPVALNYYAVALRSGGTTEPQRLIAGLGRSHLQLRRYLRSQVLAPLEPTVRHALRRVAVLDRITAERVERFAPALIPHLVELAETGVLDEHPADGTLHMHSLLRAELLEELSTSEPDTSVRDLYLEAAVVLESIDCAHEAGIARARAGHAADADTQADAAARHAVASRDLVAGNLARAADGLTATVSMLEEEGGSSSARRQLRLLNDWLAPPPGAPTSWVGAVRLELAGRPTTWAGDHGALVDGVRALVNGDHERALTHFQSAATDADQLVAVLGHLGGGLAALLIGTLDRAAYHGERAWSRCRDDGSDALALAAEALMLSFDGDADDIETLTELADDREASVLRASLHIVAATVQPAESKAAERHRRLAVDISGAAGLGGLARLASRTTSEPSQAVEPAAAMAHERSADPVREPDDRVVALELRCIGDFGLRLGGADVDVGALRPLHQELLALLTSRLDGPIHREELTELLWPGRPIAQSKQSLHTGVSAIRGWLAASGDPMGRQRLERRGEAYQLHIDPAGSDLGALREHCASAQRAISAEVAPVEDGEAILDLYVGDPYRSFGPADWAWEVRRRTHADVADVFIGWRRLAGEHFPARAEALLERVTDGVGAPSRDR